MRFFGLLVVGYYAWAVFSGYEPEELGGRQVANSGVARHAAGAGLWWSRGYQGGK